MNPQIISLGAGVQSSTMFLMSCLGDLPKADLAIFADTKAEPQAVYDHLEYLIGIGRTFGIPVEVVSAGNLEALMMSDTDAFRAVPFYTVNQDGSHGVGRRQCTSEFKIRPIYKRIREYLDQTGKKQADVWVGISTNEIRRMKDSRVKYARNIWPLIDQRMDRNDCVIWCGNNGFRQPPRSACVFCHFHNDREWKAMKLNDIDSWNRAVNVDYQVRSVGGTEYVHNSRKPLDQVQFGESDSQGDLFTNECEGMCGV